MPGGLYKAVYKQGGQGGHRLGWREVVTAPISGGITYHSIQLTRYRYVEHPTLCQQRSWNIRNGIPRSDANPNTSVAQWQWLCTHAAAAAAAAVAAAV